EDPLVQAVGQQQARLGHSEIRRGLACHLVVLGIERELLRRQRAQRLEDARRRAAGVLVQVQAQAARPRPWTLVFLHHAIRVSIDAACAVSPSARASVLTTGAMRRSPAAVTRWTVTIRTKSLAWSPPRYLAAPPVGSTWFAPMA